MAERHRSPDDPPSRATRHGDEDRSDLPERIGRDATRRIAARDRRRESPWRGLGTFGLVGWSISVPTLAGLAIGRLGDAHLDGPVSWTLSGLFAGLALGCLNAWYWIRAEQAGPDGDDADNDAGPTDRPPRPPHGSGRRRP